MFSFICTSTVKNEYISLTCCLLCEVITKLNSQCFLSSVFLFLKWQKSQKRAEIINLQVYQSFSCINVSSVKFSPLVFVHMLTVTADIRSDAKPTNTMMHLNRKPKNNETILIFDFFFCEENKCCDENIQFWYFCY